MFFFYYNDSNVFKIIIQTLNLMLVLAFVSISILGIGSIITCIYFLFIFLS